MKGQSSWFAQTTLRGEELPRGTSARRRGVGAGRDFSGPKTATCPGGGDLSALQGAGLPARTPATSPSHQLFFPLSGLESTSFCHCLGEPIYLSDKYFPLFSTLLFSSLAFVLQATLLTSMLRVVLKTSLSPDS